METNLESLEQQHRMASYILEILRYHPVIVMSWGVDPQSYRLAEDKDGNYGLSFSVNGFIHKGTVQVLYDEGSDMFLYHLLDDNGTIVNTRENICFDELVSVIDAAVEKVDNYSERVCQEYEYLTESSV